MNVRGPVTIAIVLFLSGATDAQQRPAPAPTPAPAPPALAPRSPIPPQAPAPPAPRPDPGTPAQLVNIRIDVTIAEDGGTDPPSRKTVSLTLADRQSGSVRSIEQVQDKGRANLDVDAWPRVQRDGSVQTQVTVNYSAPGPRVASIRVEPLLASGKPLMVSQSVSPTSDRRVTVELTATILK